MSVTPYTSDKSKKEQVTEMFDSISGKYDLLNRTLSMGIDRIWRSRVVREIKRQNPESLLDVATGTGDLILAAAPAVQKNMVGLDISPGMLELGIKKVAKSSFNNRIQMQVGDAENLPFPDGTFQALTCAFGVRNFENLQAGLSEFYRTLSPNGRAYILEFSRPSQGVLSALFLFYFRHILPRIGRIISKDPAAYTYLPQSVAAFPDGEDFLHILRSVGFINARQHRMTLGVATLYTAEK
jgi:demethylmenaquinone methyltransferase / 2-methoxy-6-polyprenyl-1,4-benzoquinol methylase